MAAAPPSLEVAGYRLAYSTERGALTVLDGIDLAVAHGEVLGLVGESGSGKSTLAYAVMRALPGRVEAESGRIALAGDELTALGEEALGSVRGNRVAMVFQDPGGSLNPAITLGEHFAQVLSRHRGLAGAAAREETRRLIDMVGLPDAGVMMGKYAHEVSGGEKQRAVIALAFACDPELILFDEPTSALDATTAATILDLFRELQGRTGVSALFISHDLGTVGEIAHRVAVIYAGRIVEVAPRASLFAEPRHPYTRALLASLPGHSKEARSRALVSLPGSLPDRTQAVTGCIFAPRCAFAEARCRASAIPLEQDGERAVACIRWREVFDQPLGGESALGARREPAGEAPALDVDDLEVHITRSDLLAWLMGREPPTVFAVNGVDLTLFPGETLGLVGESGCGKSSIARALVGLRPFSGGIALGERRVADAKAIDRDYRRHVQIVFQNPDASLNPRQKVATILSRPLKLYQGLSGSALSEAIAKLLERVNLTAEFMRRYPHQLSGGEKQRIAIARALAAEPAVIVCDEITSGLDASVQAAIVNLLRDIQAERGVAYLFITHDLNLLRHVADRVAVMYLGQIVESRSAASLEAPPYHPYTEALLSAAPAPGAEIDVRRVRLEGVMPTRVERTVGCPFESRCQRRIDDRCRTVAPPERTFEDDHRVLCHIEPAELAAIPPIWREAGGREEEPAT